MIRQSCLVLVLICLGFSVHAQDRDELAVRAVLSRQAAAWNRGSIAEYMQGYWKSDSLIFVGKSGPRYGYDSTLSKYLKSYPDEASMGKLRFDLLKVERISKDCFFVLGKWELKRTIGDLSGAFTLIFRKKNGDWVIVVDHSS